MRELRERHPVKRQLQIGQVLERAQASGTAKPVDPSILCGLMLGPIWYRLLMQPAPLKDAFADLLAAQTDTLATRGTRAL
ncbi:hypothetical protein GCM10008957_39630 [Deinococcus ruber]|uniref:Tetracyclin repressor-like C-terminal domain-containing protein n=2 Tax=Deinococcus ruber TaxID=1848197 RepID=A0A918FD93_9DEIO|nr:hypothetical protein GCM10008957_39630 [Deinococcus ruber]